MAKKVKLPKSEAARTPDREKDARVSFLATNPPIPANQELGY
jgi:hypothetical protein